MPTKLSHIEEQLQVLDDDGNPWRPDEDPCTDDQTAFFARVVDSVRCQARSIAAAVRGQVERGSAVMQERPFLALGVGVGVGFAAGMVHARLARS